MEFFNKAKAVRLRSHLDKFLVADDDEETVRQSRNGSSRRARWTVELLTNNPHVIRLKSCHGRYLTASDHPFLLGMTGKKVLQTTDDDATIEWEPIKEGYKVKLRTKGGKFLRANGATLPWRNSVTHDLPYRTATQDWVLWEVDMVDVSVLDGQYLSSNFSSFSSVQEDYGSCPISPLAEVRTPTKARTRDLGTVNSLLRSSIQSRLSISSDRSPRCSRRDEGMEVFRNAKTVRLQSHIGKYLVADDDELSVHQSRDGASRNARWGLERVEGKSNRIRLKSCHGLYLTAADEPYLLGMTGKKVRQTIPEKKTDVSVEWEPVKDGLHVKLMTSDGKFLRGNGGSPPWRNTVTHDMPQRTATQSWVLWSVDVVEIVVSDLNLDEEVDVDSNSIADPDLGHLSPQSSYSSAVDDHSGSPETLSPARRLSAEAGNISMNKVSAMGMFKKAKAIRLKGYHDKFLAADANQETVSQVRSSTTGASTKWTVEFVDGVENVIRLRSCYGKYLTATDDDFLMVGGSGRKVVQSLPKKLDSSVQWEPLRDGVLVKLKTRYGYYLRANGGVPPWRNSITHDIPTVHHEWVLWEVVVVEARQECEVRREDEFETSFHLHTPSHISNSSFEDSPKQSEGRLIYYHIANDEGEVNDAYEGDSFHFKGHGVAELKQKLEEETGLDNITVCTRNIVNDKLYPLRLSLPPNNSTMNVVVVPSTCQAVHDLP